MYKAMNGKAYKVCSDCWYNIQDFPKHKHIQCREVTGRKYRLESRALKFEELDNWCKDMVEYFKRPDALSEKAPLLWELYAWFVFPGLRIM